MKKYLSLMAVIFLGFCNLIQAKPFMKNFNVEQCLERVEVQRRIGVDPNYKILYYTGGNSQNIGWLEDKWAFDFIVEENQESGDELLRVSLSYTISIRGLDCEVSEVSQIVDEEEVQKVYRTYNALKSGFLDQLDI